MVILLINIVFATVKSDGFVRLTLKTCLAFFDVLFPRRCCHEVPFALSYDLEFKKCVSRDEMATVIEEVVELSMC